MRLISILVLAALATISSLAVRPVQLPIQSPIQPKEQKQMNVKRITPVLYVNEIEPCLKFWVERVGFQATAEVPDGDKLGFASLQKGNIELMYQTFASQEKETPGWSKQFRGPSFLFIEVEDLNELMAAMKGVPVELPERTTFYGSREIGYRDPGGHLILFAEFKSAPKQ
jgi:uncharacterized glyoxalase superfamily protein PhnB